MRNIILSLSRIELGELMKVGTLTFHTFNNYGSVLQAYALQNAIKKMGIDTEIIDYRNDYAHTPYTIKALKRKGLGGYLLGLAGPVSRIPRYAAFKRFRENHLDLSPRVNRQQLESGEVEKEYDLFLVGSDVVWNDAVTDFDKTFFLDWVDDASKKGSYSASFGFSEIPKGLHDDYRDALSSFAYFNMREASAVSIIGELLDREANLVLDPTLLLTNEDWSTVATDYSDKGDYIFVYQLAPSQRLIDFAQNLSKKTGYPLKFIMFPMGKPIKAQNGFTEGPSEWLGLIKDAKYVVSDSFHGTAFSIIFNKNFYTEIAPSRVGFGTRIEGILETFNLKDRLIRKPDEIDLTPIDYDQVNLELARRREDSLVVLKGMMNRHDSC